MPSPFLGLRKPPLARRRSSRADARQLPLSRLRNGPCLSEIGSEEFAQPLSGTTHRLLYQTHHHHHNAPADSAGSDLTNDRADIEAACPGHTGTGSTANQRADDLGTHAAANNAGDRIAECPKIILLQRGTGDIAAYSTRDQLNDQTDNSTPHLWAPSLGSPFARFRLAQYTIGKKGNRTAG